VKGIVADLNQKNQKQNVEFFEQNEKKNEK